MLQKILIILAVYCTMVLTLALLAAVSVGVTMGICQLFNLL